MKFESKTVVLPIDNIDTDQIIPARFLKTISKAGLGDQLFNDWRYEADGTPKTDFVLNRPDAKGAQVLVAGDNFGCGSSREHAPWALSQFGFRAVISTRSPTSSSRTRSRMVCCRSWCRQRFTRSSSRLQARPSKSIWRHRA
jgi:3-isopropylmalate dehydratase small subunit